MSSVVDTLFGAVSKKYCALFYYLSIYSFLMYVVVLVLSIIHGIKSGRGFMYYVASVGASLLFLLGYFQNRLLFSMCSH